MAEQVLIQFRADKALKQEVTEIYENLGMDLPTAFRMFMARSKMVKGLPFDAKLPEYYAVIDTNVLLSALLSKNEDSATVKVLDAVFEGKIIPLYHQDILAEYDEVLHREKFHLHEETIQIVFGAVKQYGVEVFPQPTGAVLIDMDDLVFYEVAMEKRDDDAYLVTGNQKHYPFRNFIITPAEMMAIIETTR